MDTTSQEQGQSNLTRAQEDEIIRVYIRAMYWNRNLGFRPQVRALTAEKRKELLMLALMVHAAVEQQRVQPEEASA